VRSLRPETTLVGKSPALMRVIETAAIAARTSADILIEAESGTGKELLAHYIHEHSRHQDGPFVAVNCAAVPETLLESELFGHARGAFTGAVTDREGRFEAANAGTLLLDEIGELPLALQPKLLRVLQERRIERLGDSRSIPIDTRVIATTNRNLAQLVQQGSFRADLYFRLNVIPLTLPSLRERVEDIPVLAEHFARVWAEGSQPPELTPEFIHELEHYTWPGNVRELANLVRRAMAFANGGSIGAELFQPLRVSFETSFSARSTRVVTRAQADRQLFESTLVRMNGNRTRTAEALGVSVRTVRNKIREYGLAEAIPA
jgi:two-component system, NtrC family, response regulator AtoC